MKNHWLNKYSEDERHFLKSMFFPISTSIINKFYSMQELPINTGLVHYEKSLVEQRRKEEKRRRGQ